MLRQQLIWRFRSWLRVPKNFYVQRYYPGDGIERYKVIQQGGYGKNPSTVAVGFKSNSEAIAWAKSKGLRLAR
jgi:hypothetical protein